MRILIYYSLGKILNSAGGAEKVFCNLANEMTRRGHSVLAVCHENKQGLPFYPLEPNVQFVNIGEKEASRRVPFVYKLIRALTRPFRHAPFYHVFFNPVENQRLAALNAKLQLLIKEFAPDVIVTFSINCFSAIAYADCKKPCVLTLRGNPDDFLGNINAWKKKKIEKYCSKLQVLLPSYAECLKRKISVPIIVIPNAATLPDKRFLANLSEAKSAYKIITLGRLEPDKNQHLLLETFAKIADKYPNWSVHCYGNDYSPNYVNYLKKRIAESRLEDRFLLCGVTTEPFAKLGDSDIYAFPTLHEGFPNALVEAMSVGLPCVGLKQASGVNELIINGVNGFLTENSAADFAEKLNLLMDNAQLRAKIGNAGRESVKQYAPEKIWDKWERLLLETLAVHMQFAT